MLDHSAYHDASGTVMGGPWQLRHRPVAGVAPDIVADAALSALRRVDAQMSTYRDDSDLMRLSRAPLNDFISVPPEVMTVMACADRLARLSDGAINIALGRLVNDWGFGPDATPDTRPASEASAAEAARAALGAYALRADPPAVFKHEDIAFDLCALAKGFAVDQAARAVQALGVTDFLIEAAGEIVAHGDGPGGRGWTVGLELPVPAQERLIYDDLPVEGAVATTGGYRNRREIGGEIFSHTIDPRSGAPLITDVLSVTVLNESCMEADALATVLYVLGPDEGPQFAAAHDVAALFLIRVPEGLKEIRSEAFAARTDS
ncbi:MAG: hypothetical protein CSA72_07200 [Rhodobacterales bacterium]|nr:MAG: hypothetical protein CSA72_07200 [Rhodobacterales bacterium]